MIDNEFSTAWEVLDASAMIAYLRDETGAESVEQLFTSSASRCIAHVVNVCEVFYDFYRSSGEDGAQQAIADLRRIGLIFRDDLDPDFWQEIGRLKVRPGRISLADCFVVALAQRIGGEIVTADHHEFDRLAAMGLWTIRFIR